MMQKTLEALELLDVRRGTFDLHRHPRILIVDRNVALAFLHHLPGIDAGFET